MDYKGSGTEKKFNKKRGEYGDKMEVFVKVYETTEPSMLPKWGLRSRIFKIKKRSPIQNPVNC